MMNHKRNCPCCGGCKVGKPVKLEDLDERGYKILKASGMLWEIYPLAEDTWEHELERRRKL